MYHQNPTPYKKTKQPKQPKQKRKNEHRENHQAQTTQTASIENEADETPRVLSLEEQLDAFADMLLDLYLSQLQNNDHGQD